MRASSNRRVAWRRFWLVTVPLLRPFLALAVFLSLTSAFADLANVWMLTAGRIVFPVIGTHAYWLAIKAGQFGPASALSLTLVPFLLGALLVLFRFFDRPRAGGRMNPRPWWAKLGHGSLLLLADGLLPLPDLLHARAVAEDPGGGRLRQSVHRRRIRPSRTSRSCSSAKSEVRGFVGAALRRSYPFLDWLANTLFVFAGSVVATLVVSVAAGLRARAGCGRPASGGGGARSSPPTSSRRPSSSSRSTRS